MDEGLGAIFDQVWEKIRKKLRHAYFKIHVCLPAGYRKNGKNTFGIAILRSFEKKLKNMINTSSSGSSIMAV